MDKKLKAISSLKASPESVERAVQATLKAEESGKVIKMEKTKKFNYKPVSIIAASLVAVFILGFMLYPKNENVFYLNASASEIEKGFDYKNSILGSYSSTISGSSSINTSTKDVSMIQEYHLSNLFINGKNIKAVTFKANKRCSYFDIVKNKDKFTNFVDIKKSKKELEFLNAEGYLCKGFTYLNNNNSNVEQSIDLSELFNVSYEADSKNETIKKNLDIIGKHLLSTDKVKKSYEENEEAESKIVKEMVKDSSIDITVLYNDNSEETQTIDINYFTKPNDFDNQWITFKLSKKTA